jgi:hypothetical protein
LGTKFDTAIKVCAGLLVACFLLPFFSITCQGFEVASVSGLKLMTGGELEIEGKPKKGKDADKPLPKVKSEIFAIVAFAMAAIGFGVSFVKGRQMRIANTALAGACLASLVGLYVMGQGQVDDIKNKMMKPKKEPPPGKAKNPGEEMGRKMANDIQKEIKLEASPAIGFMAACVLALVVGVLGFKAMNAPPKGGGTATAAAGPPAQGGMPPGQAPPGQMPPGGPPNA